MHVALAQVNVPTSRGQKDSSKKKLRSDNNDICHDCSYDIEEGDEDEESDETIREVSIKSSEWISEKVYE